MKKIKICLLLLLLLLFPTFVYAVNATPGSTPNPNSTARPSTPNPNSTAQPSTPAPAEPLRPTQNPNSGSVSSSLRCWYCVKYDSTHSKIEQEKAIWSQISPTNPSTNGNCMPVDTIKEKSKCTLNNVLTTLKPTPSSTVPPSYSPTVPDDTPIPPTTTDPTPSTGTSTNPGQENVYGCEVIPDEIREWIKDSLNLVKYIALVLVIVLGVLDFIKAAASGEADQMKKSGNSFLKRIIAVVILFLLPLIVELILNLIEIFGADSTCLPK